MVTPLISVIVPIYKVEKYLNECLDSIVNQTYQNLEIILVDDGSPDHCGQICDEYAQKDTRIRVIHKQNAGSGMARNTGLDIATGEYCIFPDPDDVMYLDEIEYLYTLKGIYQVDMSICGYEMGTHPKNSCRMAHQSVPCILDKKEVFKHVLTGDFSVWNKLFPMRLIGDLRFGSFFRGQDALFTVMLMTKINSIVLSSEIKYFYRISDRSVTFSKFKPNELDLLEVHQKIIDITENFEPENKSIACDLYQNTCANLMIKIITSPDFLKDIQIRKRALKRLLAEPIQGVFNARVHKMKYVLSQSLNIYLLPIAFKMVDWISKLYQLMQSLKKK